MHWNEESRFSYAVAAILGMIAGVAAKQAVAMQTGDFPRPIAILADFLVLGMIWVIAMFTHSYYPHLSLEAIALLSAALAMWGPKGISALMNRIQKGALKATEALISSQVISIGPVHRPTVLEAIEQEKILKVVDGQKYGTSAPIRKLRDVIPLEEQTPADMVEKLSQMDSPDQKSEDDEANNGGSHE